MTINTGHGQMRQEMALYLPQPVFIHGQYFEAVSRCGAASKVKVINLGGRFAELNDFLDFTTQKHHSRSMYNSHNFSDPEAVVYSTAHSPTLAYPMLFPPLF